jgi:osmotically-inducible protein OsmY
MVNFFSKLERRNASDQNSQTAGYFMNVRTVISAGLIGIVIISSTGCAVSRGQESVGAYVDDAGITTKVKAQLLDNKDVSGTSISVETLKGTVLLSGFAKNMTEKNTAERIARNVKGVKEVKNEITVRP